MMSKYRNVPVVVDGMRFASAAEYGRYRVLSLKEKAGDDAVRLTHAFRLCLARSPSSSELGALTTLLAEARRHYAENAADATAAVGTYTIPGTSPAETAAWIATARILLNMDEFITRE